MPLIVQVILGKTRGLCQGHAATRDAAALMLGTGIEEHEIPSTQKKPQSGLYMHFVHQPFSNLAYY
jgi:hypothetical protein